MTPPITYITDCADCNALARLYARLASLFGTGPSLFGVSGPRADLEAALSLLNALQAATERLGQPAHPGIFLVNVAPRGDKTQGENGTPFCYFWYKDNLVISTLGGRTLSLVRQYLGIDTVCVVDISEVMKTAAASDWADFTEAELKDIAGTQFRSLWFVPLLARWLWDEHEVPNFAHSTPDVTVGQVVLCVDSFGNMKVHARPEDLNFRPGQLLPVHHGRWWRFIRSTRRVRCYEHLADVPRGQLALIIGSGDLVEVVVQRGSAAKHLGSKVGDRVF